VSFLIQSVLNDALLAIDDPAGRNVAPAEQLSFYNRTARKVAKRLNVIEYEAFYDHVQNTDLYKLPSDCKTVRKMFATLTPTDTYSYWELDEIFEDEHAGLTNRQTASSDPRKYFMRQEYFQIYPAPATTIERGGKMVYWGLPPDSLNPSIDLAPFPDIVREILTEGVIIHLLKRMTRLEEAMSRAQEWEASMTQDRDVMEDRSRDRRPNLRARNRFNSYYDGQV